MITKEQYEALKPYEKQIMAAYRNGFVHMQGSDFQVVAEIYKDIFGTTLTKSQMSCNTCRLNALRKLGEAYSIYGTEIKKTNRGRPRKLKDGKTE